MRHALFLSLVVSCFCGTAQSAPRDVFSSNVDTIFAKFDSADVPGCAVGVIRNGEYIHAKGYGSANLEHGIPIGRDSVFRVALFLNSLRLLLSPFWLAVAIWI